MRSLLPGMTRRWGAEVMGAMRMSSAGPARETAKEKRARARLVHERARDGGGTPAPAVAED